MPIRRGVSYDQISHISAILYFLLALHMLKLYALQGNVMSIIMFIMG